MKLLDLYISDNIEALDQVAMEKCPQYDSYNFKSMKMGLNTLYKGITLHRADQEKCYILVKRFLVLVDRMRKKMADETFVNLIYGQEIRQAERLHVTLREELQIRYAEYAAALGATTRPPIVAKADPEPDKSEESEFDNFEDKFILMDGMITPKQLYKKIIRRDNILILDIRPVNDYTDCTLDFPNVINIPPQNISEGVSANVLGQTMDPDKKKLWEMRDEFQAIILMDWNSNISYESKEIGIIRRSLTDWDFNKVYKYPPILLNGGFYEYIETYPTGVTNINFQYDNRYYMLDEMLDLDSIAYPEELATSQAEGSDLERVTSDLNLLKIMDEKQSSKKHPEQSSQDPRPGKPDTTTPSPSEDSSDRSSKKSHSSDDSDSGELGTPVYVDGKKVGTRFFIDPEKIKKQMEVDRMRELEKARLPPKPVTKAEKMGKSFDVSKKLPSGGGLFSSKAKPNSNPQPEQDPEPQPNPQTNQPAREYTSRRVIAKRRGSLELSGRGRIGHRRPLVPSRAIKPRPAAAALEPEAILTEMSKLDDMNIVGLININNTCYMNALLQCLRACPQVRALLQTDLYKQYMIQRPQILPVLAELFATLQTTNARAIAPTAFYNRVKELRPSYGNGAHEDCMEFFIFVLNMLVDDTTIFITEQQRLNIDNSWHGRQMANRSIFMDLFYFQLRTDRFCHNCKINTPHVETDNTLMLAVPNYFCDLRDLMDQYTASFSLIDFVCNVCKKPLEHTRKFLRMPPVLAIVLKRYYLDKDKGDQFQKNSERVTFPHRNFVVGGVSYRLAGMAVHDGTLTSGHYTAIVLDSRNRWIECNDEHVSAIDINSPRIKNLAYAFIYCKSD